MQPFAFRPDVLAPEEKSSLHHNYRAAQWEQNHHKQQILFIHPSLALLPSKEMSSLNSKVALCMIQLESRVMIQGKLTQVTGEKKTLQKKSPIV